jgi:hypothetical protein
MITPATYDITILQNSTWSGILRATDSGQTLDSFTINAGTPTFTKNCHGLTAGDKVVFTGGTTVPCGFTVNTIYYVISAGLTTDEFQVSATSGGASISVTGTATGTFYVARPLDLTNYTIDADIKELENLTQVATFTCTITDATNGEFNLLLQPATTVGLAVGRYGYDVSLTSSGGTRYYWLTGVATVQLTYSRN